MVSETSVKLGQKKQGRQPERVLRLNEDTGLVELAGSKKEVDTARSRGKRFLPSWRSKKSQCKW